MGLSINRTENHLPISQQEHPSLVLLFWAAYHEVLSWVKGLEGAQSCSV